MRAVLRWGLALVLADLLTGIAGFSLILLGAVGLAFYTGMSQGLTSVFVGGPIEIFVAVGMTATALLALRGYRWVARIARGTGSPWATPA
jgi:hypothetical protein